MGCVVSRRRKCMVYCHVAESTSPSMHFIKSATTDDTIQNSSTAASTENATSTQGLTLALVHCSAQRKRFLWDRG